MPVLCVLFSQGLSCPLPLSIPGPATTMKMKPGIKQRILALLAAVVAWALLCLALFTYYTDRHSEELQQPNGENRRLTSIQADNRSQAREGEAEEVRRTKTPSRWSGKTKEELSAQSVIRKMWRGDVSARILSRYLRRSQENFLNNNKLRAFYKGLHKTQLRGRELLCEMKKQVRFRTLDGTEEPFSRLGWDRLVPTRPLDQLYPTQFSTCAVVTSAGTLLNSSLGKEIGEFLVGLWYCSRQLC